jgi:FtsZ-binding cell division protein ZapB
MIDHLMIEHGRSEKWATQKTDEAFAKTFAQEAEELKQHRQEVIQEIVDIETAADEMLNHNEAVKEQGDIAERMWEPTIERRTIDSYTWFLSETDVLFIEESLARKCEEIRDDLNKINFRTEAPRKVVVDNRERTAEWTDEDGMFLADSLHRLSSILFQSRFLRNNPNDRRAL